MLLTSVTCQDDEKECVSVKGIYFEKEREFSDSGIYIPYLKQESEGQP
jgi:hypothetical protein